MLRINEFLYELCDKQRWLCYYCERYLLLDINSQQRPTVEHRVPKSKAKYRSSFINNLVAACYRCNNAKGDLDEGLFRQKVLPLLLNDDKISNKIRLDV